MSEYCPHPGCGGGLEPGWRCCPFCGGSGGRLAVEADRRLPATADEPETAELILRVPGSGAEHRHALRVRARGVGPVRFRLLDEGRPPWLAFNVREWEVTPEKEQEVPLTVYLRRARQEGYPVGEVLLESQDGPRVEPWGLHQTRRTRLLVNLEARAPGSLAAATDVVLLGTSLRENSLRLENAGGSPMEVRLRDRVPGLDIRPVGAPFRGGFVTVPAAGRFGPGSVEFLVCLEDPARIPEDALAVFVSPDQEAPVAIRIVMERGGVSRTLPDLLVGLDFGTENCSVVVRNLRREFLDGLRRKDGAGRSVQTLPFQFGDAREWKRFPAYLEYDQKARLQPGSVNANLKGSGTPEDVDVIWNLKLAARELGEGGRHAFLDSEELRGSPRVEEYRTDRVLQDLFDFLCRAVAGKLPVRAQGDGSRAFVLTVPASVYGEQEDDGGLPGLLRETFRRSASKVPEMGIRPGDAFLVAPEPTCAMLSVLGDESEAIGVLADGSVALVLDAGAGTTDFTAVRVRSREGEERLLEVLYSSGTPLPFQQPWKEGQPFQYVDLLKPSGDAALPLFAGRISDQILFDLLAYTASEGDASVRDFEDLRDLRNRLRQIQAGLSKAWSDAHLSQREFWALLESAKCLLGSRSRLDFLQDLSILDTAANPAKRNLDRFLRSIGAGALVLTRANYENLVADRLGTLLRMVARQMQDVGVEPGEVDRVITVGGTSRLSVIPQCLSAVFPRAEICHPQSLVDEAVARGSALWLDPPLDLWPHDVSALMPDGAILPLLKSATVLPVAGPEDEISLGGASLDFQGGHVDPVVHLRLDHPEVGGCLARIRVSRDFAGEARGVPISFALRRRGTRADLVVRCARAGASPLELATVRLR